MLRTELAHSTRRVSWWTLLGLLLVPLVLLGGLFAAARPNTNQIKAAIVNLDAAVTIDGQVVPLGRQLAAAMTDRDENISWTLADSPSAETGLQNGTYSAVIVIPKNFSAAATSFSGQADQANQATIDVRVGANSPVTDAAVAQQIARAAADVINSSLTKGYLDKIYLGFNTLGDQFVTISDGAKQLADGATKLDTGLGDAAVGAGKLADGVDQFAAGMPQLVSGINRLSSDGGKLLDGVGAYAQGASGVVGGVDQLAKGARAFEAQVRTGTSDFSGIQQLASGASGVASGASGVSSGISQVAGALQGYAGGAPAPGAAAFPAAAFGCPAQGPQVCGTLQAAWEGGFKAGTGTGAAMLTTPDPASGSSLQQGAAALASGAGQLSAGVAQLATQLPAQAAAQQAQLADGIGKLASGAEEIATKAQPLVQQGPALSSGASEFKAGLTKLSSQVAGLPSGANQLAKGSHDLATGLVDARSGATKLAEGLTTFSTKLAAGASDVPRYNQTDRAALTKVVSRPIATDDSLLTSPLASTMAVLLAAGLWLGAMVNYLVMRPIPSRALTSSRPSWQLTAAALSPGVALAAVQAVVLGVLGTWLLGLSAGTGTALVAVLLLAGVAFVAVNHAVAAWFGGWGRLVVLGLAIVAVATGLTSGVPSAIAGLTILSPVTPALNAIRTLGTGASLTEPVGALFLWLIVGVVAGYIAIARHRQLSVAQFVRSRG